MRRLKRYERPKVVDLTANDWNVPFGEGYSQLNPNSGGTPSKIGCVDGNSPGMFACSTGYGVST